MKVLLLKEKSFDRKKVQSDKEQKREHKTKQPM